MPASVSDVVGDLVAAGGQCSGAHGALAAAAEHGERLRRETQAMELHALTGRLTGLGTDLEAALGRVAELMAACEQAGARCAALTDAPLAVSVPTLRPAPGLRPLGVAEPIRERADRRLQAAVRMQNEAAEVLARHGFRIRTLAQEQGTTSPDYDIEGRPFDCYTPDPTTSLDNVRRKLKFKIDKGQAQRFVVNLDRSRHEPADLRRHLERARPRRLIEVLAVKGGVVHRVWP